MILNLILYLGLLTTACDFKPSFKADIDGDGVPDIAYTTPGAVPLDDKNEE